MGLNTKNNLNAPTEWSQRWQEGRTGWDHGKPHQELETLLKEARILKNFTLEGKILEPGCGRAHAGAWLSSQGHHVTSFDFVDIAIEEARKLYGHLKQLTLSLHHALEHNPSWDGGFDAIFDRAMLCALGPEWRDSYLKRCHSYLKPGGLFLSIPFIEVEGPAHEGPPFQIPLDQLEQLLSPYFRIIQISEPFSTSEIGKVKKEVRLIGERIQL
jgi:cyclopropane fatty-acyl-phospholipid synthase-like methyltransferase